MKSSRLYRNLLAFSLFLFVYTEACAAEGPINTYLTYFSNFAYGGPEIRFSWSDNKFRIKTLVDTTQDFNSKYLRVKYSQPFMQYDTILGLKLGRSYFIKAIFVDASNNVIGTWASPAPFQVYGHPVIGDIDFMKDKVVNNSLVNNFDWYAGAIIENELYYDTVPTFNSKAFRQLLSKGQTQSFLHLTNDRKHYYLKSRAKYRNQVLDWKTVEVDNRFRMQVVGPATQCVTGKEFVYEFHNFQAYGAKMVNRVYSRVVFDYGQNRDSIDLGSDYSINYGFSYSQVKSMKRYYATCKFEIDSDIVLINDTSILSLSELHDDTYLGYMQGNFNFRIGGLACARDSFTIEVYTDSNFSNRIFKLDSAGAGIFTYVDLHILPFKYSEGHVIRYRSTFSGISKPWKYIWGLREPMQLTSMLPQFGQLNDTWRLAKNYVIPGQFVEMQLDTSRTFNSERRKTFFLRDSSTMILPMLFGNHNYARVRSVHNTSISVWSDTAIRNCFNGVPPAIGCSAVYPQLRLSGFEWYPNRTELRYSQNPNNLNYSSKLIQQPYGPMQLGKMVYVQQRFFSDVDTSPWTPVYSCIASNALNICCTPLIYYYGYDNGLDTFCIRWMNYNESKICGYYIFVMSGGQFYGHFYAKSTDTVFTFNRKQFPNGTAFRLESDCDLKANKEVPVDLPLNKLSMNDLFVSHAGALYWSQESARLYSSLPGKLMVYDLGGKVYVSTELAGQFESVDLAGLPIGTYIAVIRDGSLCYTLKLIR